MGLKVVGFNVGEIVVGLKVVGFNVGVKVDVVLGAVVGIAVLGMGVGFEVMGCQDVVGDMVGISETGA